MIYTIILLFVYLGSIKTIISFSFEKKSIRSLTKYINCKGPTISELFKLQRYYQKSYVLRLSNQDNDSIDEVFSIKSSDEKKAEAKIAKEIEQKQNIEGFLNNDLLSMESGKQVRVTLYILFAILPCLLLIPFMMDRSFIPTDIDPNEMMGK